MYAQKRTLLGVSLLQPSYPSPQSAMPRRSAQDRSFHGRVILIVQRTWVIAHGLATAFEVKGAQVVMAREARLGSSLTEIRDLSAAVLDRHNLELCQPLKVRGVPFVLYTGRAVVNHNCAAAAIIRKPAPAAEVVARVEEMLSRP
jgi:DNA-binding response OmpR family regulator